MTDISEPDSELWTYVVNDGGHPKDHLWPPDSETEVAALSVSWAGASAAVDDAVKATGNASKELLGAWPDPAGFSMHYSLDTTNNGSGGEGGIHDIAMAHAKIASFCGSYSQQLMSVKKAVCQVIHANEGKFELAGIMGGTSITGWNAEGARVARRWFARRVANDIVAMMGEKQDRGFLDYVSAFGAGLFNAFAGNLEGLTALVGFDWENGWSWGTAGHAWKSLAELGLLFSSVGPEALLFNETVDLPFLHKGEIADTAIGAGKFLTAWDDWSKDPAYAAGEVTMNVGALLVARGASSGLRALATAAKASDVASVARFGTLLDRAMNLPKIRDVAIDGLRNLPKAVEPVRDVVGRDRPHLTEPPRADPPGPQEPGPGSPQPHSPEPPGPPHPPENVRPETPPRTDPPATGGSGHPDPAPRPESPAPRSDHGSPVETRPHTGEGPAPGASPAPHGDHASAPARPSASPEPGVSPAPHTAAGSVPDTAAAHPSTVEPRAGGNPAAEAPRSAPAMGEHSPARPDAASGEPGTSGSIVHSGQTADRPGGRAGGPARPPQAEPPASSPRRERSGEPETVPEKPPWQDVTAHLDPENQAARLSDTLPPEQLRATTGVDRDAAWWAQKEWAEAAPVQPRTLPQKVLFAVVRGAGTLHTAIEMAEGHSLTPSSEPPKPHPTREPVPKHRETEPAGGRSTSDSLPPGDPGLPPRPGKDNHVVHVDPAPGKVDRADPPERSREHAPANAGIHDVINPPADDLGSHHGGDSHDSTPASEIPPPLVRDQPLPTKDLEQPFRGEDDPHNPQRFFHPDTVKYMNPLELERHRLFVRDGKLYHASDGAPFDTTGASTLHSVGQPRAMFVMDEHGNLYASNQQIRGRLHHSSFLGGRPVVSAGEIAVRDGVPSLVSRKSGHYQPLEEHQQRLRETLAEQGVDVDGIVFEDGF